MSEFTKGPWLTRHLVEALKAVLDAGDEGCCEECMVKDAVAKAALAKAEGRE